MKSILKSVLLFVVLMPSLSFIPQKDGDKIVYDKNKPLVWSDFLGKPDNSSGTQAYTFSEMSSTCSWMDDSATINLTRFFDKHKSWVKMDKANDYLLKHEQGHFDLTEIYYRKLVKKLKEYRFTAKTFSTDFNKINSTNSSDLNKEQDLYDKETNHSIIELKQKEWDARIATHLKDLEDYTATKVVVHLH